MNVLGPKKINVFVVSLRLQNHSKEKKKACLLKKMGGRKNMFIVSQFSRCSSCSVTDYAALLRGSSIVMGNFFHLTGNAVGYLQK